MCFVDLVILYLASAIALHYSEGYIPSLIFLSGGPILNNSSWAAMKIRMTEETDWKILKEIRLAALLDTPTAFGVSYQSTITHSDEQWKYRASSKTYPKFWLAFQNGNLCNQ